MPNNRTHYDNDFTTFPNSIMKDLRMTPAERGFLHYIFSKPQDWHYIIPVLAREFGASESSIYKWHRRLKEFGYITDLIIRDEKGRFKRHDWMVYAFPQNERTAERVEESKAKVVNLFD